MLFNTNYINYLNFHSIPFLSLFFLTTKIYLSDVKSLLLNTYVFNTIPNYGLSQTNNIGSCIPIIDSNTTIIPYTEISSISKTIPISFPTTNIAGNIYNIISFNNTSCLHTQIILYNQLIDISPSLQLHSFPVSILAQTGEFIVIQSNAGIESLTIDSTTTTTTIPKILYWTSSNGGYYMFKVTPEMIGYTLYYSSTIHIGVSIWIVVSGPNDRVVMVPSSSGTQQDINVPIGTRIVWALEPGATKSYVRLAEADGSVVPFDALLWTLAYGGGAQQGVVNQRPLEYRHRFAATPIHVSPGIFYYKDMFQVQNSYTHRVLVANQNGDAPTAPPTNETVPEFRDYFATSRYGIKCDCTFGGQGLACNNISSSSSSV